MHVIFLICLFRYLFFMDTGKISSWKKIHKFKDSYDFKSLSVLFKRRTTIFILYQEIKIIINITSQKWYFITHVWAILTIKVFLMNFFLRQSAQTCKEKLGAFRKGLKKLPLEFGNVNIGFRLFRMIFTILRYYWCLWENIWTSLPFMQLF